MRYLRKFVTIVVTFLFGLELGGFGMWYLALKAIKDSPEERATRANRYQSYRYNKE